MVTHLTNPGQTGKHGNPSESEGRKPCKWRNGLRRVCQPSRRVLHVTAARGVHGAPRREGRGLWEEWPLASPRGDALPAGRAGQDDRSRPRGRHRTLRPLCGESHAPTFPGGGGTVGQLGGRGSPWWALSCRVWMGVTVCTFLKVTEASHPCCQSLGPEMRVGLGLSRRDPWPLL